MGFKLMLTFIIYFTYPVFSFYFDDTRTDFDSAWSSCVLATPPIDFSHSGNTIELDLAEDLGDDESAWIGYVQDYEIFQYMGCIQWANLKAASQYSKSITLKPDIGQCFSVCRTSEYFAVRFQLKNKVNWRALCRCINVTDEVLALKSLTNCSNTDENNEFSVAEPKYFSAYRIVTKDVSEALRESVDWNTAGYNCSKLQTPSSNEYQWDNCSANLEPICVNNGIHSTFRRYGYIKRTNSDDVYSLHFGPGNKIRKSLCEEKKDPGVQTSITSSSSTPKQETSSTATTAVEKDFSTSIASTTLASSSKSNTDAFVGNMQAETSSNVAVFAAIPVVVILLVCGIIAGVFFCRKRRLHKSSTDDLSRQNLTYSKHNINNSPDSRPNTSEYYNEVDGIDESTQDDYDMIKGDWESEPTRNSVDNHSYFVLEKTQTGKFEVVKTDDYDYAKEAETDDPLPQNHTYHVLEKTHTTNASSPFTNNSTGYDYAKVSPKGSDEAANKGPKVEQVPRIASTDTDYDHLDDGRKETKAPHQVKTKEGDHVYNTSGKNTTTDTYDHIDKGVPDIKGSLVEHAYPNNGQKNTYNNLKDMVNSYNRVNQGQISVDDEKRYNVINPPRVRPTNTDNPYDHKG